MYNSIVAMMIESYSLICVSCMIGFSGVSFKTYGESI
jgi:hypothetical protein